MTNQEIFTIAMQQSAIDLNCKADDFLQNENKIVISKKNEAARRYLELPFVCNLVSYGNNVVASVQKEYEELVREYIEKYPMEHCFETPNMHVLNDAFEKHDMRVCFMAEYFLPDVSLLKEIDCGYEHRILEQKDFADYPVMIVPAYQLADPQLVERWTKYAKEGGHLVLTCRTAHKDRYGRLPEIPFGSWINSLTGNEMEFYDLLLPEEPGVVKMGDKEYRWNTWGEILKPGRGVEVWATYAEEFYEGKPAVTTRKLGRGTVTYVGVDSSDGSLERDVLKRLYAQLDIEVMDLPYGVTMEYRNGMGIVLNYSDKPYHFDLPAGAKPLIGSAEIPTAGVFVFAIAK